MLPFISELQAEQQASSLLCSLLSELDSTLQLLSATETSTKSYSSIYNSNTSTDAASHDSTTQTVSVKSACLCPTPTDSTPQSSQHKNTHQQVAVHLLSTSCHRLVHLARLAGLAGLAGPLPLNNNHKLNRWRLMMFRSTVWVHYGK